MPATIRKHVPRHIIVSTARSFLGTPFAHQGRLQGMALDCVGLPLMICGKLGMLDKNGEPLNGDTYREYPEQPDGSYVQDVCFQHLEMKPPREMLPGDVLTLQVESAPCHVAIVGEKNGVLTLIHAIGGGVNKCVEHAIDYRWNKRITCCFRFPEAEDTWRG